MDSELSEAKTKLEQESRKEKLHLQKQNKLQIELQSLKNEGNKSEDSYEKMINKLQADLKKAENKKSNEMEKLRTTVVGWIKITNNAEIIAKYEALKQEV